MQLPLQTFSSLVKRMAATVQGASSTLLDLTVGSVLLSILQANASIALWIQWLITLVLSATRLATSSGEDCDSFGADFGFSRLPAVAATGYVTFSRFADNLQAVVPIGAMVATTGNTQRFEVVVDTKNPAYNATLSGYEIAVGAASITVAISAMQPGSAGNVQAGTISLLSSAISGVDTVTNSLPLTGGLDAESDAAFKLRFSTYLAGLSKATNIAIGDAIASIQQGISYAIVENMDQNGNFRPGNFIVTVDDGAGTPSESFIANLQQVVNAVRPIGTSFVVQAPTIIMANIAMSLVTDSLSDHQVSINAVETAIGNYIASLQVSEALSYTRLAQLAYDASSSITNVTGLLLNGEVNDLAPGQFGLVKSGSMVIF